MSSRELLEWWAYYKIEPFGFERDDFRSALQTNWIVNTLIGLLGGKRSKRIEFEKVLLDFGNQKHEPGPDELKVKIEKLNELFGGLDLREED